MAGKTRTIRTSLDIPEDLHRRIHEAAKRRGCSARALILSSIEREVTLEPRPKGRIKVPLISTGGPPINPTPEEIDDAVFS